MMSDERIIKSVGSQCPSGGNDVRSQSPKDDMSKFRRFSYPRPPPLIPFCTGEEGNVMANSAPYTALSNSILSHFPGTTPPNTFNTNDFRNEDQSTVSLFFTPQHYRHPFENARYSRESGSSYSSNESSVNSIGVMNRYRGTVNPVFTRHHSYGLRRTESPMTAFEAKDIQEQTFIEPDHALSREAETNQDTCVVPLPKLPPLSVIGSVSVLHRDDQPRNGSISSNSSDGIESSWIRRYNKLIEYKNANGDTNVPQKFKDDNLGVWVNKQRMEKRKLDKGQKSSLTEARIGLLQELGFNWGKAKGQSSWDIKFIEIVAFKKKHKHCNVPTKFAENTALGRWVTSQRYDYRNGTIDQGNKSKLDSIGFVWDYFGSPRNQK